MEGTNRIPGVSFYSGFLLCAVIAQRTSVSGADRFAPDLRLLLVEFVFKHTHNQLLVPLLRFLEPTLHTLVSRIWRLFATCFRISALPTLADSPTEFRANRAPFTDPALALRAATDTFSTWTSSMWVAQLRISGRICSVSVLIFTCAGISALPTRVHRPSEFHGHRASFTNPASAQRFAICVFSTWPCAAVQPCHRRRIWNPDSPFLYSPALRRVGF